MRALICVLALGCAASAHLAPQKFAPPSDLAATSDRIHAAQLASALGELEATLRDEVAKHKLPSLAFGVVTDEGLVWFRGFGARDLETKERITADTVFRIRSITKV